MAVLCSVWIQGIGSEYVEAEPNLLCHFVREIPGTRVID
eukprot:SAG22_NODE_454_length_10311_cov_4.304446_5_plen_39_part_00